MPMLKEVSTFTSLVTTPTVVLLLVLTSTHSVRPTVLQVMKLDTLVTWVTSQLTLMVWLKVPLLTSWSNWLVQTLFSVEPLLSTLVLMTWVKVKTLNPRRPVTLVPDQLVVSLVFPIKSDPSTLVGCFNNWHWPTLTTWWMKTVLLRFRCFSVYMRISIYFAWINVSKKKIMTNVLLWIAYPNKRFYFICSLRCP